MGFHRLQSHERYPDYDLEECKDLPGLTVEKDNVWNIVVALDRDEELDFKQAKMAYEEWQRRLSEMEDRALLQARRTNLIPYPDGSWANKGPLLGQAAADARDPSSSSV